MNSKLCKELGIEFPLFAFSHCRDVVAAVTKAGGFGVFGATNLSGPELEVYLNWIAVSYTHLTLPTKRIV